MHKVILLMIVLVLSMIGYCLSAREVKCDLQIICNDAWFNNLVGSPGIIVKETHLLTLNDVGTNNFVLVTANNVDYPSGQNMDILNLPNLIRWYGTFPSVVHPKFRPLPLGPKMSWSSTSINGEDGRVQQNKIINAITASKFEIASSERKIFLYTNFDVNTTNNPHIKEHKGTRQRLKDHLQRTNLYHDQPRLSFETYMKDLSNSVFCVCPPGNGVDSHRTWEALLLGCIPIVLYYEPIIPLYENLPVYIVNDWEEITEESLLMKQMEIAAKEYTDVKLYMNFWLSQIRSETTGTETIL